MSPCIKICKIDEKSGLCIGCLRTLNEIKKWKDLSSSKQTEILDDIAWVRSSVYKFDLESITKSM